jgi:hypothetical protein
MAVPMICTMVVKNGDVVYRCTGCDVQWTVPVSQSASVWWDMYNGRAVLEALGHYMKTHPPGTEYHRPSLADFPIVPPIEGG